MRELAALTRRGLVAAAPAAIVAAAVPVLAAKGVNTTDTLLLSLRGPYERTMARMDAVSPAHDRAETAYFAAKTAHPDLDERALRKISGLVAAERIWQRAVDANTVVIEQITETPARSMAGLVFKASVAEKDGYNLDLMSSIVTDLLAMGGLDA